MTEQLRLNGVYWGLTALHLLGHPEALPREDTIKFVLSCQNSDGGFGAAPGHDSHMLYTTSAIQILATIDALSDLDASPHGSGEKVGQCECMHDSNVCSELTSQSLPAGRIQALVLSPVMSGARRTLDSYIVLSSRCLS